MKTLPRVGYWFSDSSGVLPHGDGRPIVIGQKLSIKGKLVICRNALHGSFHPFDALQYAPGPILHRVLFSSARVEYSDKVGSRSRTVLASVDATAMLRQFARTQALSVIHLWEAPTIVREYLETGDETKRDAATAAATAAAWAAAATAAAAARAAAARAAAAAARDAAAWAAAREAAAAAATAAREAAAWAAAREAAWAAAAAAAAARDAAAWAAATAAGDAATAARDAAAWAAARKQFNDLVQELFATTAQDR